MYHHVVEILAISSHPNKLLKCSKFSKIEALGMADGLTNLRQVEFFKHINPIWAVEENVRTILGMVRAELTLEGNCNMASK